jgi:ATP-dependent Clp protease ATP-binding subunit ClpX
MARKTDKTGAQGVDMSQTWYCSFCLKSQHEVAMLVAGPARVSICDVCVGLAGEWVAGRTPDISGYPPPDKLPTERLLNQLPAIESHYRGQGTQLEWVVDQLRSRKVSWAAIGEKLGVSRQAAWERFS